MKPASRRPRVVGVVVLALVGLILLFVIASLSLDKGDDQKIEITGASEVQTQLGGIAQDGPRLGAHGAPVTVQVFNDLQCEPCAGYESEVISPLIDGPVRSGEIALEYHHFPMSQSGFGLASYGGVAAAKQDDEWQFVQLFFHNQSEAKQGGATQDFLDRIAGAILNFNVEQWQNDMDDDDVAETLKADDELAAEHRFPAEPAIVVDGPRGTRELIESPSLDRINEAIAAVS